MKDVEAGLQCVGSYFVVDYDDGTSKIITRMVILGDLEWLTDEITYYHFREGTEQPEKVYDDGCDALRYALFSDETRGTFKRQVGYVPRKGHGYTPRTERSKLIYGG